MINNKSDNIEGLFLEALVGSPVSVFLITGIQLKGMLSSCGERVVTVERAGHTQMVYKHAISTIRLADS